MRSKLNISKDYLLLINFAESLDMKINLFLGKLIDIRNTIQTDKLTLLLEEISNKINFYGSYALRLIKNFPEFSFILNRINKSSEEIGILLKKWFKESSNRSIKISQIEGQLKFIQLDSREILSKINDQN